MAAVGGSVWRTAVQLWRRMPQPPAAVTPAGLRQMSTSESILNKKLDGKVAIITGAASGLGAATAKLFAAHGAQVVVADVKDEQGHDTCSKIGSNAHYKHCDVSNEEEIASTVDFAVHKFGKLDVMHNNAGVPSGFENFEDLNLEDYDRVTSIMVRGVVAGIKHASRVMIPNKQGVILNTASTASVSVMDGIPIGYNINKSNLPGLTRVAAYHLGKHGIRVNAVSPHGVYTPIFVSAINQLTGGQFADHEVIQAFIRKSTLSGKMCIEEDIANGALFLCSDDARYVSGQNLVIDGGWCNSKDYNIVDDLLSMAQ